METIRVLKIHDKDNGHMLYRLDDKEAALHCFDGLKNNFETGEAHTISVEDMTPEQWTEAEKLGEEMA